MSGHVFILRADVTRLACDAWLMPCGWNTYQPNPSFRPPSDPLWLYTPLDRAQRVEKVAAREPVPPHTPQPWRVVVGRRNQDPQTIDWYVDGVRQWFEALRPEFQPSGGTRRNSIAFGRHKPLLALPLVGTGFGGAANHAGAVAQALLPLLWNMAGELDADIALCLREKPHYAAAQAVRNRSAECRQAWAAELGEDRCRRARELGQVASGGGLALFLGAGVSRGAGLPTWDELLAGMADKADLSPDDRDRFDRLANPLDRASILEQRLGQGKPLGEAIRLALGPGNYHALSHALLAGLPVREAVTTNYDRLFERAWAFALSDLPTSDGWDRFTVLPHSRRAADRWLLKMHGDIEHPETMVLSRRDYLRYDANRAALAGVVQGTLINRHVLFVGFSLSDDNFHRIIDSVRRVVEASGGQRDQGPLGTALMLAHNPLLAQLWGTDLRWVALDDREPDRWEPERQGPFPWGEIARRQEVFLDCLLAHTHPVPPLLDWRFEGILDPSEKKLRTALVRLVEELQEDLGNEAGNTRSRQLLLMFLREVGYEPGRPLRAPAE
jgi:hypothetical protein